KKLENLNSSLFELLENAWTNWINSTSLDNLTFFVDLFDKIERKLRPL
ncbi:MAG: hypothetical protein RIQ33_512, partial [Bacteroidota bacterium]